MILVDTSVWIDHLRRGESGLIRQLEVGEVLIHPFILGELALGSLKNRTEVLGALSELPGVPVATDNEVLYFIEAHSLFSLGIGYVDTHLLAATKLVQGTLLWTRDKRLLSAARGLGVAYNEVH